MWKSFYSIAFVSLLMIACNQEEKPKLTYENQEKEVGFQKIDSAEIKIADLPIHLQGTDVIIHPIGDVRVYNSGNSRYGSSKTKSVSFTISNYNYPEITGFIYNLKFQHKDSTQMHLLTQNRMQIQSVTYLDKIALQSPEKILVYTVVDKDTNRDGKYDSNDIKALYISNIDGSHFMKLTEDLHELIDWNVIEVKNRLYFRSVEDNNKNGAFDNSDNVNYYYVDLLDNEWKPIAYNPLE